MADEAQALIDLLGEVPTRYRVLGAVHKINAALTPQGARLAEADAQEVIATMGAVPTKYGLTRHYDLLRMRLAQAQQQSAVRDRDNLEGIVEDHERD